MPRKKTYQFTLEAPQEQDEKPSRSAKKRHAHALQALGETLTRLTPAKRQQLHLPSALCEALTDYDHMKSHESRRRQLQFIGRIMRECDATAIRTALEIAKQ